MNILNTIPTEIVTGTEYKLVWTPWSIIGMVIVVAIVIVGCMVIKYSWDEVEALPGVIGILLFVLALVILLGPVLQHETTATVNQYEVTIDETVPFSEIMDKYDVIEQRGNIYVLQDKVPEGENTNG